MALRRHGMTWTLMVALLLGVLGLPNVPATAQVTPDPLVPLGADGLVNEIGGDWPTLDEALPDRVPRGGSLERSGACWGDDARGGTGASVFVMLSRQRSDQDRAHTFDSVSTFAPVAPDGRFSFVLELRADQLPGRYRVTISCDHLDVGFALARGEIQVVGTDPRPAFDDVANGHLHAEAIRTLAWYGIILGCGPGRYCPSDTITRAELASLVDRAQRIEFDGHASNHQIAVRPTPLPPSATPRFVDVNPGSAHAGAIERLAANGVILGYGNDRFRPQRAIRRDEAASMFWRSRESRVIDNDHPGFLDVRAGSAHYQAISILANFYQVRGCHAESEFGSDSVPLAS